MSPVPSQETGSLLHTYQRMRGRSLSRWVKTYRIKQSGITGLKMRESFLLLTRAKLVDYEKCLMFIVVHVRSSRHLCIYNWSCSLPHSQWVAFMGSNLKVSAVISELAIDFFFKWDYICISCQSAHYFAWVVISETMAFFFCKMPLYSCIYIYVYYIMLEVHCIFKMVHFSYCS